MTFSRASEIGKGTTSQSAEKRWFVSGHRFSDAVTATQSMAPLGAEGTGLVFQQTLQMCGRRLRYQLAFDDIFIISTRNS
jgi:hypothetical protein